jgi:phage terminase large subunit
MLGRAATTTRDRVTGEDARATCGARVTRDSRATEIVINDAYLGLLEDDSRWLVLYGGAGSGKSVFAAQKVLIRIMTERGHKIVVTRKVARTLRNSVFALLIGLMQEWAVAEQFEVTQSEMRIRHLRTGNEILFVGLDNPEKMKSIAGVTGFWHEEPTEQTPADLTQCDLRLRGETANYKQHILSFNPISALHWLKGRFFDQADPRARVVKTTYRDNAFLDADYVGQLHALRDIDEQWYRVYTLGEWGVLKGVIYRAWQVVAREDWPEAFDETIWGLDFGFNNPTALVRCGLRDGKVYLKEGLYESGLTTADLIGRLEASGVRKRETLYADAAEPDRIEEIRRAGWDARPAKKAKGSVQAGIAFCQAQHILVLDGSTNVISENNTYKWREDKDGKVLDEPAKVHDHAMDAIRYALFTHLARGSATAIDRRLLGF